MKVKAETAVGPVRGRTIEGVETRTDACVFMLIKLCRDVLQCMHVCVRVCVCDQCVRAPGGSGGGGAGVVVVAAVALCVQSTC